MRRGSVAMKSVLSGIRLSIESLIFMKKTTKIINFFAGIVSVLAFLTGCAQTKWSTSLDSQFGGLKTCDMSEMYVDAYDMKTVGSYFTERSLEPCRLEELAYFCVHDNFHGMPVSQIAIPYKGFSIYALYIDAAPEYVAERLGWPELARPVGIDEEGGGKALPQAVAAQNDASRTILFCEPYEEP